MKAQKNTISENIKQALLIRPRTRKEIVRLVITDFKPDMLTDHEYNEAYKTNLRGYYSAFFTDCKHFGNIEKINGKYHVTKSCQVEGNGLWSMNKDRKIQILERRLKNINNQWQEIRHLSRRENELMAEVGRLQGITRGLHTEVDELTADKKHLVDQLFAMDSQSKRYKFKAENNENEININIRLDITK